MSSIMSRCPNCGLVPAYITHVCLPVTRVATPQIIPVTPTMDYEKEALRREVGQLKIKIQGHRRHMERHFPEDHHPLACWDEIEAAVAETRVLFEQWWVLQMPIESPIESLDVQPLAWEAWKAALGLQERG